MTGGTVGVRLGSPTGELIGESAKIIPVASPAEGMPAPSIVAAKVKPVTGFQDVYFVYKNEESAPGRMLFVMLQIHFGYNPKLTTVASR